MSNPKYDSRHCFECDRPELCDVIRPGTAPCGINAGFVVGDLPPLPASPEKAIEGTPDAATLQRAVVFAADGIEGEWCPADRAAEMAATAKSLRWLADALPGMMQAKALNERTQAALDATEIGGIYDEFKDPADAIEQFALHVRDLTAARLFDSDCYRNRIAELESTIADLRAERSQLRARISELPRYRPGLDEEENAVMVADGSGNYIDRDDVRGTNA